MKTLKQDPLWPAFVKYAKKINVSLKEKADWLPWWQCFKAGAMVLYVEHKDLADEKRLSTEETFRHAGDIQTGRRKKTISKIAKKGRSKEDDVLYRL